VLPATAVNVIGPLSAAYAEPDNLRTLTAVIDTPARRAESAVGRCLSPGSSVLAGVLVLLPVPVYGEGVIVLPGLGRPGLRDLGASPRRCPMATTISSAALVPVTPVFSNTERLALTGFLAGYSGLTRQAYDLDLRQYAAWCQSHQLRLFQARRADIECFARDLEAHGRARATITRRLSTVAGFYRYAVEEDLLDHSPAAHVAPPAAGLRITRHPDPILGEPGRGPCQG
jgi:hypothetical protein